MKFVRQHPSRRLRSATMRPERMFRDPADVVAASDMDRVAKIMLLSNWDSRLRELLDTCGRDPENDEPRHLGFMQSRVLEALTALNATRP